MSRNLLRWPFVILVALAAFAPANAESYGERGVVVECRDCWIYWRPADDKWRMEVEYRIDESEWRHVQNHREHAGTELQIPGTSVVLKVEDGRYWHDHGEDVRELRWLP